MWSPPRRVWTIAGPDSTKRWGCARRGRPQRRAASKETAARDDMIRTAHRVGALLRQIAEASGLGRKTVTAAVETDPP